MSAFKYRNHGREEPTIPKAHLRLIATVERAYLAWCERRNLNPYDIYNDGTGVVRQAKFEAASARSRRWHAKIRGEVKLAKARREEARRQTTRSNG